MSATLTADHLKGIAMRAGHLRQGTVAMMVFFLTVASCSSADEGPGPDGPVGPAGEDEGIPGSGTITQELHEIDSFTDFVFESEGTVELELSETAHVIVEADDNLHEYLEAIATGSTLTVATREGIDIAPSQSILFRVQTSDLDSITFAGVGSLAMQEWVSPQAVRIEMAGTGDVTIGNLVAESLTVDVSGVGSVEVAGNVDVQNVTLTGTGDYRARGLESKSCTVSAIGTGTATVWATDTLDALAEAPGSVEYFGAPTTTTAGDGRIVGRER